MYSLIAARSKTLLIWGGLEALLGGLVWQSYRKQPALSPALIQASKRTQKS